MTAQCQPKRQQPSRPDLSSYAFADAAVDIERFIREGDLAAVDTILSQWQMSPSSRILVPEARNPLSVCTHFALEEGQITLLQDLLARGVLLHPRAAWDAIKQAQDADDTTLLDMMFDTGNWDVTDIFFGFSLGIYSRIFQNEKFLHWFLLRGPPLAQHHRPGIENAARYASIPTLCLLLELGVSFVQTDAIILATIGHNEGLTARLDAVRLLAQHGAPVNVIRMQFWDIKRWMSFFVATNRKTALHYAAEGGKADMVQLLLELGADPTCTTFDEETPRDLATKKGHLDTVEVLDEAMGRNEGADKGT